MNTKRETKSRPALRTPAIFKTILILATLSLVLPAGAFAQSDEEGVLDQARKKYDAALAAAAQTTTDTANTTNGDTGSTASNTATSSSTTSTSVDANGVHVDVDVTVTVNKKDGAFAAEASEAEESIGAPTVAEEEKKRRDFRFFAFQAFPNSKFRDSNTALAVGLIVSNVGGVRGFQTGLIGSIAEDVAGVQTGTIFAISHEDVAIGQAAGIFTIAGDTVIGVQAAGVFNRADTIYGIQASGVFNSADEVNGAQISTVNIAKKVRGLQIGLVNIADEIDGLAIGLINVSKNGLNEQIFWADENCYGYGGVLLGYKGFLVLGYAGSSIDDIGVSADSLTGGFNVGYRFGKGGPFFQVDAGVKARIEVSPELWTADSRKLEGSINAMGFPNLRLSGGWNIWGPFSVFGGVSADFASKSLWTMPGDYASDLSFDIGDDLSAHLSWFFGFSL